MKHIVGFSGGVDSQAVARWVLNRFPHDDVILLNSDAGENEDPLTLAFVEKYSATVFPVIACNALVSDMWKTDGFAETKGLVGSEKLTFDRMMEIKGRPPSRKAQFCTEILKLRPQARWCKLNVTDDYERYTGVRRQESESRKNTPFREWDDYFDCYVNHPLADWTKQMCFDYVKFHGEEINPLYTLGFNRVGCAPCINSGKDDILHWLHRRPEMIDKIRNWERKLGRTYFAPCVPGLYTNSIDQVIEWSATDRGGRQTNMLRVLNEHPACESKYGLCE
jgi:3'-phosphoadenosine 5'-phosphosulfate sulfotransferase (PAPS reductase)/FAD synthetase